MSTLPENWQQTTDPTGRVYYWNTVTREVTYNLPSVQSADSPLPPNWRESESNGKKYYYNTVTQQTQWERPIAETPPVASVPEVDDGWKEATTPEGKVYYYKNNEVSWTKPGAAAAAAVVPASSTPVTSAPIPASTPAPVAVPATPISSAPTPTATSFFSQSASACPSTPAQTSAGNASAAALSPSNFFIPRASMASQFSPSFSSSLHTGPVTMDAIGANKGNARTYNREFNRPVNMRSNGMFKSWGGIIAAVETRATLQVLDEKKGKTKASIALDHSLAVPVNRNDGRFLLLLYEYEPTVCVNLDTDTAAATKEHLFDLTSETIREDFLSVISNHGCEIRRAAWEGLVSVNGKDRYLVVYNTAALLFRKQSDESPEATVEITASTFFMHQGSTYPLMYDSSTYGPVTNRTIILGNTGDEGETLYYITARDDVAFGLMKAAVDECVGKRWRPLDSSSLLEGYLYKANSSHTRWARRYCVLRSDKLVYYRERNTNKAAGEVFLPGGFEVELMASTDPSHPFKIHVSESGDEGTRIFPICALTEWEYQRWGEALVALQERKKDKKDRESVREGYAWVIAKGKKPQKRFVALRKDKALLYAARHDLVESSTITLTDKVTVAPWSIPGDDATVAGARLHTLCIGNIANSGPGGGTSDIFLGVQLESDLGAWLTEFRNIVGHGPVSGAVREGFGYKSKAKGVTGVLKYFLLMDDKLYYHNQKTQSISECKAFDLCGDVPPVTLTDDALNKEGWFGFSIANSGDDGAKVMHVYFESALERDGWVNTINNVLSKRDWRRDKNSLREGYFYKASSNGKSWTRRYMVLTTNRLLYYKKKHDTEPAGEVALPGGFVCGRITVDPGMSNVSLVDKPAIEAAASTLRLKPHDLRVFFIAPTGDTDERKYWLCVETEVELQQWLGSLTSLSQSKSAKVFANSVIEGYLHVNGRQPSCRRYVVVLGDKITWYKRKLDVVADGVRELPPGFDVWIKPEEEEQDMGTFYIGAEANENINDVTNYTSFSIFEHSGELSMWLLAIRSLHERRTNKPCYPVLHHGYLYSEKAPVQTFQNNSASLLPRKLRFVTMCADRLMLYRTRGECYVNEAPPASLRASLSSGLITCNLDNVVDACEMHIPTLTSQNAIKLITEHHENALKFSIRLGSVVYTFTARSMTEKQQWCQAFHNTIDGSNTGDGCITTNVTAAAPAPANTFVYANDAFILNNAPPVPSRASIAVQGMSPASSSLPRPVLSVSSSTSSTRSATQLAGTGIPAAVTAPVPPVAPPVPIVAPIVATPLPAPTSSASASSTSLTSGAFAARPVPSSPSSLCAATLSTPEPALCPSSPLPPPPSSPFSDAHSPVLVPASPIPLPPSSTFSSPLPPPPAEPPSPIPLPPSHSFSPMPAPASLPPFHESDEDDAPPPPPSLASPAPLPPSHSPAMSTFPSMPPPPSVSLPLPPSLPSSPVPSFPTPQLSRQDSSSSCASDIDAPPPARVLENKRGSQRITSIPILPSARDKFTVGASLTRPSLNPIQAAPGTIPQPLVPLGAPPLPSGPLGTVPRAGLPPLPEHSPAIPTGSGMGVGHAPQRFLDSDEEDSDEEGDLPPPPSFNHHPSVSGARPQDYNNGANVTAYPRAPLSPPAVAATRSATSYSISAPPIALELPPLPPAVDIPPIPAAQAFSNAAYVNVNVAAAQEVDDDEDRPLTPPPGPPPRF